MEDEKYVRWAIFSIFISNIIWLTNSNQNLMQSPPKKVILYYIYIKNTHYSSNLVFQITLNNINFVKIKIWSPNTKNETQNEMQHIL
jgi:hypothetical protein